MKDLSTKTLFISLFLPVAVLFVMQENVTKPPSIPQSAAKMQSFQKIFTPALLEVVDQCTGTKPIYGYKEGLEKIKVLLENGEDINARRYVAAGFGSGGTTALMKASCEGYEEIVNFFLARNADVDITDDIGKTALMQASERGHLNIAQSLVANTTDVNMATHRGDTALILASRWGKAEIVKLLLENGAKVNKKGFFNLTALTEALIGHPEVSADCSSKIVKLLKSVKKREKPCWLLPFDVLFGPYNVEE